MLKLCKTVGKYLNTVCKNIVSWKQMKDSIKNLWCPTTQAESCFGHSVQEAEQVNPAAMNTSHKTETDQTES